MSYHNDKIADEVSDALRELFVPNQQTGISVMQELEAETLLAQDPYKKPNSYLKR